jgi:hypothetical protein
MKKIILSIIVLIIAGASFSFKNNSHSHSDHFMCNYSGHSYSGSGELTLHKPAPVAVERVNAIMNTVGLKQNFSIHSANVPNASALVNGSSRYILYNPRFMEQVRNAAGVDWTSYAILAHEVGHHLNGHTIQRGGSNPAIELEADEFSGFVLGKMGASLAEAQAAMRLIASPKTSKTHPGKHSRLNAIETGWKKAKIQS